MYKKMTGNVMLAILFVLAITLTLAGQKCKVSAESSSIPVTAVSCAGEFTVALKNDGTVWTWGHLFIGDFMARITPNPVRAGNLTNVIAIASGDQHAIALKTDGTVWGWGNNESKQLGDGILARHLATPVQIEGLDNVKAISAGAWYTIVIKHDGTVWGCGYGYEGFNIRTDVPDPLNDLSEVVAVAAGDTCSVVLKSDGTVWAWGNYNSNNNYGELGIGTRYEYRESRSPVQVKALSGVSAIAAGSSFNFALKSNGTVWAWGCNRYGQLGDGTESDRKIPVQVSSWNGITDIAGGSGHTIALKSDGTVWTCGLNDQGQLGDGTNTDKNIPVQVRGLSNVIAIAAGPFNSAAVKKDGTLWVWGKNEFMQLGDGTNIDRNTPVRVSF